MEGKDILNWNILLSVIFASGLVGMGGKLLFIIYQSEILGYAHYFPAFPNVLDSLFIFFASIYFLWGKIKGIRKSNETHK